MDVESAINLAVRSNFPNVNVRHEQRDGLKFILEGKDVVALLPTGYGKSLLYQVLPTIHHTLEHSRHIVAVVTPLKAIMVQQTTELRKKGIRTACLGRSDSDDQMIRDCAVDVVFGSAELWLSDKWKRELLTGDLGKAVSEIFVDEAHTVIEWYEYLITYIYRKTYPYQVRNVALTKFHFIDFCKKSKFCFHFSLIPIIKTLENQMRENTQQHKPKRNPIN